MNYYSSIITEAKSDKKLSKDFTLIGSDSKTDIARQYLKQLDDRMQELKLSYDQCREAAKLFKHCEFEHALKKIWGNKVKYDERNEENGYRTIRTYDVPGWAIYTETIETGVLGTYSHNIRIDFESVENPEYSLSNPISIYIKSKGTDFLAQREMANCDAFKNLSTAHIYNCLFVGFAGRDLSSALSRFHLKLSNKL